MLVTQLEVTSLFIYPVKSLRGIELESTRLTLRGLDHDRRFMVTRTNGRFVTQRDLSTLALIHTGLADGGLVLSRHGFGSVRVPFERFDGRPIESKVWNDPCETIDQGEEIAEWLTRAAESEAPLRLVAMNPDFTRSLNKSEILGSETTTFFADASPYLVANLASLDRLNSELGTKSLDSVPMNRFRPNIVVKGLAPFAEHQVSTINGPDYSLALRYPCERCVVTTINQETGERDPQKQPFKTLAGINPMPGNQKAPAFAENAILKSGEGRRIAVGDLLRAD